jgi:hypothetical protein
LLSSHDHMLFDMLTGGHAPYLRFGPLLENSVRLEADLHHEAAATTTQLRETFGVKLDNPSTVPQDLDAIVAEMWNTGWDPEKGNVNLFAGELGLNLAEAMLALLGGRLVFRDENNFLHCSIFWLDAKIEAFPFHKTVKCLRNRDGDSMAYFVKGLSDEIGASRPPTR